MANVVKMRDITFDKSLFDNYLTRTPLDRLICSYNGLPKGVNYMVIGDPGSGKTTIALDVLANITRHYPSARILFVSAEMNHIDLAACVQRYPKFKDIDILFIESDFCGTESTHNLAAIESTLDYGWDSRHRLVPRAARHRPRGRKHPHERRRESAAGYD
ncbi:unknown [Prevotella sp. CAG:873]|nr:unknown [Prevotella sp. CAG:873]